MHMRTEIGIVIKGYVLGLLKKQIPSDSLVRRALTIPSYIKKTTACQAFLNLRDFSIVANASYIAVYLRSLDTVR